MTWPEAVKCAKAMAKVTGLPTCVAVKLGHCEAVFEHHAATLKRDGWVCKEAAYSTPSGRPSPGEFGSGMDYGLCADARERVVIRLHKLKDAMSREGAARKSRWSALEFDLSAAAYVEGASSAQIAAITGRTEKAVVSTMNSSGITKRTYNRSIHGC